jgi:hypothetical protein
MGSARRAGRGAKSIAAFAVTAVACGSAGSFAPVEPQAPAPQAPAPVEVRAPEVDASSGQSLSDLSTSEDASADASVTATATPAPSSGIDAGQHAAPPPLPLGTCDGPMPDPRCAKAFPTKVTCPAKFGDVPKGEYCGLDGTTAPARCSYPEGVCRCIHIPYCGGVYPSQLQMMGMKWSCGPPQKPDDCPRQASEGAACGKNGQSCAYGGCGVSTSCVCKNGRYKCTTQHWAPPP